MNMNGQPMQRVNLDAMDEITSVPTIVANKFYLTMRDGHLRITFAEEFPEIDKTKARVAVALSEQAFYAFVGMLNGYVAQQESNAKNKPDVGVNTIEHEDVKPAAVEIPDEVVK